MFDHDLLYQGFSPGGRDYEMILYESVDPNPAYKLVPCHLKFLFRFCVEVVAESKLNDSAWNRAREDRLSEEYEPSLLSPGTPWSQRFEVLYPGAQLIEDSPKARSWEQKVGLPFHEVVIEGNVQLRSLVFLDLEFEEVGDGYAPYRVTQDGEVERFAASTKIPLKPSNSTDARKPDVTS
jgi:hypothetical protein